MKRLFSPHKSVAPYQIPLGTVLGVPYLILVIVSILVVGVFSFYNGQKAVNEVAKQLRNEAMLGIEQHLTTFVNTPHQINRLNAHTIQSGEIDLQSTAQLQSHFLELIMTHPSVTSVYFGNVNGGMTGAGREGMGNDFYVTGTQNFIKGEFQKYRVNENGVISMPALAIVPNFDARLRPWYVRAIQEKDEGWSDIYVLFTGQDMAIAASRPVYAPDGSLAGVASVDIFLSQLSQYLETLSISQVGQVFIMESTGLLVATSTGEAPIIDLDGDGKKERLSYQSSSSDALQTAGSLLLEEYGNFYNLPTDIQQFEFRLNDEKVFAQSMLFKDNRGLEWVVISIIPESAYTQQIIQSRNQTVWLILAALAVTGITSTVVSSRIRKRIAQLNISTQALASGQWSSDLSENTRIAELNRLTVNFNEMKRKLHETLEERSREIEERILIEKKLEKEAARKQLLFDESPDGIIVLDPNTTRFIEFNTAAHEQLGYTREEYAQLKITDIEMAGSEQAIAGRIESVRQTGKADFDTVHRKKDGALRDMRVRVQLIELQEQIVYYCILRDITEQKKLETEIQKQYEFFTNIFNLMGQGLTVTNAEGRFEFVNPAYASMFGYAPEELIGKLPDAITLQEDRQLLDEQRRLRQEGASSTYESRIICANGQIAHALITSVPRDVQGHQKGAITVITDLSKQKKVEEELREAKKELEKALLREMSLARTDELTKINNRRHLFELAELKFAVATRYRQPLSVLMFDIDHFKMVNDLWGHVTGDIVLAEVAKMVQSQLRTPDLFGRYGGEEFIILLPMTSAEQAHVLAERIRNKISDMFVTTERGTVSVTISTGVAELRHGNTPESIEQLFSRADEALYTAKQTGRNRTVISPS